MPGTWAVQMGHLHLLILPLVQDWPGISCSYFHGKMCITKLKVWRNPQGRAGWVWRAVKVAIFMGS